MDGRPVKGIYFIRSKQKHYTEKSGIVIPADYEKYKIDRVNQCGTVEAAPIKEDLGVEDGDKIYFHHFVTDDDRVVSEDSYDNSKDRYQRESDDKIFYAPTHEIYCKIVDGKIVMLGQWNFVEPVGETEEDIKTESGIYFKPNPETEYLRGVIRHLSDGMKEMDVKEGDKVIFKIDREYEIKIEGDIYYRIQDDDILAIEESV